MCLCIWSMYSVMTVLLILFFRVWGHVWYMSACIHVHRCVIICVEGCMHTCAYVLMEAWSGPPDFYVGSGDLNSSPQAHCLGQKCFENCAFSLVLDYTLWILLWVLNSSENTRWLLFFWLIGFPGEIGFAHSMAHYTWTEGDWSASARSLSKLWMESGGNPGYCGYQLTWELLWIEFIFFVQLKAPWHWAQQLRCHRASGLDRIRRGVNGSLPGEFWHMLSEQGLGAHKYASAHLHKRTAHMQSRSWSHKDPFGKFSLEGKDKRICNEFRDCIA